MKITAILFPLFIVTGCSAIPYKDLNLDTTSNFRHPTEGKSGVYVYQWKSGILGALYDVKFEIKEGPSIRLNTGEFGYFEVEPGQYEFNGDGGPIKAYYPVEFEANKNYFFRAYMSYGIGYNYLVRDQNEIDEAKRNILAGKYEIFSID